MKSLVVLLMLISLAAVTQPAPIANSSGLAAASTGSAENISQTVDADSSQAARIIAPAPPAHKQRSSRRPARIDLTTPFYRFGRMPIRIKD